MHRHDGEVRLTSALGTGSTFTLWFPATRVASGPATAEISPR